MKRTVFTFILFVAVLALAIPQGARTPPGSYGIALADLNGEGQPGCGGTVETASTFFLPSRGRPIVTKVTGEKEPVLRPASINSSPSTRPDRLISILILYG